MTPSPFCETETLCDLGVGDSQSRGERIYMHNTPVCVDGDPEESWSPLEGGSQ